jgi:hypothetical protein
VSLAPLRSLSHLKAGRTEHPIPDVPRAGRSFVVGLCIVCGVAALLRWPIVNMPLERDEGEYAYIAQRWLRGDVPYRDAFDQKPPGVFVAYAVIETVIGTSPTALHWGAQIYSFGTLIVIALIGRRFGGDRAGLLAALFAAYMAAERCVLGNAANTETFMILPLAAAFLCTLIAIDRGCWVWAFASGVLSCLAMQFKQVALPNAVYHGLLLLILARPRIRLCVAYVVGGVLAIVPTALYFWSVGAFHEFFDCVVGHNLSYAQRVPLDEYPLQFWDTFGFIQTKWWPILVFAVIGTFVRGRGRSARLLLNTWLLFSFFGVCAGGYFREHYFFQIIPAGAVLAGRGVNWLAERMAPERPTRLAWPIAAGMILYGVFVSSDIDFDRDEQGEVHLKANISFWPWYFWPGDPIHKVDRVYGNCPFGESLALADYLRHESGPDETTFVFGSEPQIPYYAGRKSASRYIFVYPLMTPFADTAERQQGVLEELEQARPRFIVVARQSSSFFEHEDAPPRLRAGIAEMLQLDYRLVAIADTDGTSVKPFTRTVMKEGFPQPATKCTLAVWRRVD